MNQQLVQQTENKAFVIGVLKEKKIDFKVSSNGRQMASGKLVVICDTPVGKGEIEVRVMQFADKKDGTPNSLFKALETIENTYKSVVEFGEENADTIIIDGSLEDETYYSVNKGDFVEKLQIKGTFIKRAEANTPHVCKVGFEGLITKTTPKENELEVEMVGIGYQGVAVPLTTTVPEHLVGAFQGRYMIGSTATLYMAILNVVKVKEEEKEMGFGEGLGKKITTTINKRIVVGGEMPKYQGIAGALTDETVKQGLALRQAKLESKKEEAMKKASGVGMENGFSGVNAGFGAGMTAGAPTGGFNNMAPTGGFGGSMPTGNFGGFPQQ